MHAAFRYLNIYDLKRWTGSLRCAGEKITGAVVTRCFCSPYPGDGHLTPSHNPSLTTSGFLWKVIEATAATVRRFLGENGWVSAGPGIHPVYPLSSQPFEEMRMGERSGVVSGQKRAWLDSALNLQWKKGGYARVCRTIDGWTNEWRADWLTNWLTERERERETEWQNEGRNEWMQACWQSVPRH